MKRWPLLMVCLLLAGCATTQREMKTVPHVDLTRYTGKWYDIASLPAWFQSGCHNATAEYAALPNGRIDVMNRCTMDNGETRTAHGTAKVVPNSGNAKLKVRFGPITGDYYIIGLDPQYRWAVVGHPSRKYLWFLSRTPKVDDATYARFLQIAKEHGYTNLDRLRR